MEHQATLLVTLALAFVMAFGLGFLASKVGLPPLVGYLVAGIAIGPFSPGFRADPAIATQLAEIGVILLMFGVGLHFSTADLMAVRGIAVPGALLQMACATAIGTAVAMSWGWSLAGGLIFGLALSIASTVVILRALGERGAVETASGRVVIAWTVVEDLASVLVLVLLPAIARMSGGSGHAEAVGGLEGNLWLLVTITLAKIAVFLVLVAVVGPRAVPWLLRQAATTGSHELFTLAVLAVSLGIAYGAAQLFGVSFALGAFCAGVVLSNSELSHRAAQESLPLQHAFSVLFFVSVGMLFDPTILVRDPIAVVIVVLIIMVGKSLAALALVQFMGFPVRTGLWVSASLAQIGEFSFILAGLAIALGMMPTEGRDLILAGSLLSVSLSPAAFKAIDPIVAWTGRRRRLMARLGPAQDLRLARLQATLDANVHAGAAALPPDELVSRWKVFGDLDLGKRADLLTLFKPRSAVPGDRLIRAGDKADEVFFISSGAVEVSRGKRKIRLGPGDFFGEMALLTGAPRSADVTAIDYCQLLTLGQKDFQGFVSRHPELRAKINEIATARETMNRTDPDTGPEVGVRS